MVSEDHARTGLRPFHHRRRRQRLRHRARCGGARPERGAGRNGRPGAGHLVGLDQALSRRAALSGISRAAAGARRRWPSARCCWCAMPHISWPMRFVLPTHPSMRFAGGTPISTLLGLVMPWMRGRRPAWVIRAGLFLYDHMGGRKILPGTRKIDLRSDPAGAPLNPKFTDAFEYSDCWVDDSRLVVLNARDAAARGARGHGARPCDPRAQREGDLWRIVDRGRGRAAGTPRPRAGQCRRAMGGRGDGRRAGGTSGRAGAAGARQPYRDAAAFRPRPRLFLSGRGRAHRLCHSLRAGFHADRHHRP